MCPRWTSGSMSCMTVSDFTRRVGCYLCMMAVSAATWRKQKFTYSIERWQIICSSSKKSLYKGTNSHVTDEEDRTSWWLCQVREQVKKNAKLSYRGLSVLSAPLSSTSSGFDLPGVCITSSVVVFNILPSRYSILWMVYNYICPLPCFPGTWQYP